jgi:hypothetical protein
MTNKQSNKQTNKQTNNSCWLHNAFAIPPMIVNLKQSFKKGFHTMQAARSEIMTPIHLNGVENESSQPTQPTKASLLHQSSLTTTNQPRNSSPSLSHATSLQICEASDDADHCAPPSLCKGLGCGGREPNFTGSLTDES